MKIVEDIQGVHILEFPEILIVLIYLGAHPYIQSLRYHLYFQELLWHSLVH